MRRAIVMTGRATKILGAATIVGASFFATLLVTPASPQSELFTPEPFVPWLMKFIQPTAAVETGSDLPVPRPRSGQQQAMAHQHEQHSQQQPTSRPREQATPPMPKFLLGPTMVPPDEPAIQQQPARMAMPAREEPVQQGPKFLLGPTMVPPDEDSVQPTRIAAQGPTRI